MVRSRLPACSCQQLSETLSTRRRPITGLLRQATARLRKPLAVDLLKPAQWLTPSTKPAARCRH